MTVEAGIHPFTPTRLAQRLPFPARRVPVYRADVLVLGTGVAGMSAALAAADEGAHTMALSKGGIHATNTRYAQGGIAAAVGEDDHPKFHAGDTLSVGCGLSDTAVVDAITAEAPNAIQWLIRAGMKFDRTQAGELELGREGGHRSARVLHSNGTATGLELQRSLTALMRNHPRIDLFEYVVAVDLLKDAEGRVAGILALVGRDSVTAEPVFFEASEVVLATGGGGQIFRETTNPPVATGDGLGMALRAGAELQDLEFVQFHPTILYLAGAARFLISEVTRGAGAVLRDRHGNAFMADFHQDAELAPRDVVSRAIFRRMVETGDTHVYLDLAPVRDAEARFPTLARITGEFGLDIRSQPIPVRPAVHYFVGGVLADLNGRTTVPGLWATGECSSIGFHGANRMGSNSLLEGLVHGRMVGRHVGGRLANPRRFLLPKQTSRNAAEGAELSLADMTYSLKSLMWRQVGIERHREGLTDALQRMLAWEGYLDRLGPFSREGVEVLNMVQVAQMIGLCALHREESRGTHHRVDYPESHPQYHAHTRIHAREGTLLIQETPVAGHAHSTGPVSEGDVNLSQSSNSVSD